MALDQAAFNATLTAIESNESDFAPYLSNNVLELGSQNITSTDAEVISSALKINDSLKYLYLYNDIIGVTGAIA